MSIATQLITAEEFLKMDLGPGTFELVRGEIVEMPPALPDHGRVCLNSGVNLELYGRQTGYGYAVSNDSAVLIERDPDTVRGGDICFYSEARVPRKLLGPGIPLLPPDLVVEVLSPSNRPGEVLQKVSEYLRAGVLLVWVIDPVKRLLLIYRPDELVPTVLLDHDAVENLPELPGFRCLVSDFFV